MENAEIKSPMFEAEPGWGGKLAIILKRYSYSFLIPLFAVVVVILSINILSAKYATQISTRSNTANSFESKPTIQVVAERGQGISHLAKEVLNSYLIKDPLMNIGSGQKAFIINYIGNLYADVPVILGKSVEFKKDDLLLAIKKSERLTDYQIEEWSKYYSE